MANTKIPVELSSTPGIVDNSNATAITIDSSENVGIGETSPQAGLDIASTAKGIFTSGNVYPYPTGNAYIKVKGTNAEHNWIGITGGYEQSSGSANLMLQPNFRLTSEQAGNYIGSEAQSVTTADITFGKLVGGSSTSTNATKSEFMRIDSSGNLLVGKTATGLGNQGAELSSTGQLKGTAPNQVVAYLNRTSSDGSIAEFRKDNSAVGSIGVVSSNNLKIHSTSSGHSGLSFGTGIVYATDNSGNATNGGTDLGSSSYRWKDLYLSGGAYLGGTGAANHLDDYEEGTFTPAFAGSGGNPTVDYNTQVGIYTKIGNMVLVEIRIVTNSVSSGSGNLSISGLPFTARNNQGVAGALAKAFVYNWATDPEVFLTTGGGTTVAIYSSDAANTQAQVSHLNTGGPTNYTTISGAYLI